MPRAKKPPTDEAPEKEKPAAKKTAAKKTTKKSAKSEISAEELEALAEFAGVPRTKPKPKAAAAEAPAIGMKAMIRGRSSAGFGEIVAVEDGTAKVRFCTDTVNFVEHEAAFDQIFHAQLPNQSRVFHKAEGVVRFGRVMATKQTTGPIRSYLVHFPGVATLTELKEDEFSVRSYLTGDDPSTVVAELAQETPFFFQQRSDLLAQLLKQNQLAHGLPALLSSKVEVLQHQAEIAERVLRDPVIRYLLADEVGLGKTIEAGIIMRQIRLDAPDARIAVVAPDALTRQWREELDSRFGLDDVELFPHSALEKDKELHGEAWDVLVMDEAHRIVARQGVEESPVTRGALKLAHKAKHLLLLSATPVLHHDADLLALLELLDPENYNSDKLAAFKERTEKRVELGRAFLALRSATVPALVKLHAGKLAALLPEDERVKALVASLTEPGTDAKAVQHELHLHISETYRIHRRMLRTRRRWLSGSQKRFVRDVQETVEIELDEEPHGNLWTALDEWRVEISERIAPGDKLRPVAAASYVRLSEAIAAEPEKLGDLVKEIAKLTKATKDEEKLLAELVDENAAWEMSEARLDLVAESLRRRAAKDGRDGKYVVFCPTARLCADLGKRLVQNFNSEGVKLASTSAARSQVGELFSDFAGDPLARVLITDATGEEGFNLQFAKAVFFYDLPWSPMRLEQRLGRLDRIDRVGHIPCVVFTTGEDDSIALDETWRMVLAEGFGLYKASISDLQHLVDTELPRLSEIVFAGGPQALLEAIPALAEAVVKERSSIEEQDVIDGMHSLSPQSQLTLDLEAADNAAEEFGTAFSGYLLRNLGLEERWDEETNSFMFRMKRDSNPLLPADKLESLASMFATKFTVHRSVCIEDLTLDFLRPGHPAVDGGRDLLAWDDRGRAWAMWRAVPSIKTPKLIFRNIVRVTVDLRAVEKAVAAVEWDPVRRGGLLRLVRGWFPEIAVEFWCDEIGNDPAAKLIEPCKKPYHFKADRNMGKERAGHLREKFGEDEWRKACQTAAKRAIQAVRKGTELATAKERAMKQATDHFAMLRARLEARAQAGIDSDAQATAETKLEEDVAKLVNEIILSPVVTLDTMGVYILSEKPWWDDPDWDPELAARAAKRAATS
jgi:ATP-dependent helicase HepA